MPKFELKILEAVKGKQAFFYIEIDGQCQYDEFQEEIKGNPQYEAEHRTILSYMNFVADLKGLLPKSKFRDVTPAKDKYKEYEFKSKNLRAYVFHVEITGKVVAYWGFKNNQAKDFVQFRSIKKQYIESKTIKESDGNKKRITGK